MYLLRKAMWDVAYTTLEKTITFPQKKKKTITQN